MVNVHKNNNFFLKGVQQGGCFTALWFTSGWEIIGCGEEVLSILLAWQEGGELQAADDEKQGDRTLEPLRG